MSFIQISISDIVKDLRVDLVLREGCPLLDANTEKHLKSIEHAIEQLQAGNPKPALSLYNGLLIKAKKASRASLTCAINNEAAQGRNKEVSHIQAIHATLKAMNSAESRLLRSA